MSIPRTLTEMEDWLLSLSPEQLAAWKLKLAAEGWLAPAEPGCADEDHKRAWRDRTDWWSGS